MRRIRGLFLLVLVSGCCCDPEDPSDPATTAEAKLVEGWLDDLAHRRDEAALQKLRFIGPPPEGWTPERFGQRIDRLRVFRSIEEIEWTEARYLLNEVNRDSNDPIGERVLTCFSNINPPLRLEATVRAGGAAHRLEVIVSDRDGLRLGQVHINGKSLVPSDEPTIFRAAVEHRPPGELLRQTTIDRTTVGLTTFMRAKSPVAVSPASSVRLRADCRYGDRWYRHEIVTNVAEPLNLFTRLPPSSPDLCRVRVRVSEEKIVESRAWCWTPAKTETGPCLERPIPRRRSEAPVLVDDVARRVTDDGLLRIDYALHANENFPRPGAPERHHLEVRVLCSDQTPRKATRPINREQQPFGLFLRPAALYSEPASAFDLPCDVQFELVRETPYERKTWSVFEGCLTESEVIPKPCPQTRVK